ncbi:Tat pathway signal sequence domain protein [Actinomyces johnsonii F0510]|uniref:Tat pathway signal sequence domain protein n=1 Tax=Actinomyces johnsonii F0510 TaxID=1227262 RepID=U1RHP1_9ACTO|nr:Tat pathway signal sequence domain protein [Actinomyces johnsonii]ERH18007.1 Tat pathway signal sequence domain protein [Actinomyces johnsonii F0510]
MSTAQSTAMVRRILTDRTEAGGALAGWGTCLQILLRRFRVQIAAWVLPLWLLISVTAPSYESIYPSLETRTVLIEQMRKSPATRLLYGYVPTPGRLGQLLQWETGTFLLICTALMAILLTCRVLRADEDEGLVEILRAAGAGRAVPFLVPVALVWAAVGALSAGAGGILTWQAKNIEELTVSGAWALAGTVCVVGWAFSALAAVASQLGRQVGQARSLSMIVLALAFGMRVAADQVAEGSSSNWLRWLSPLGWRDLVRPYSDDRFAVLAVCGVIAIALVIVAAALAAHREYLDSYLPDHSASRRRWRLRGHMDLLTRLSRRGALGWALASTGLAALYGSVSGSVNDLLAPDSPTASYVGKMASGSAVEQFMSLLTVVTVLLVAVAAVRRMNRLAGLEHAGLVEVELATGVSRSRLFLSQVLGAMIESAILLVISAAVLAATTAVQLTDDHAVARAFVFTVSQMPGMVAAIGIAAGLVGLAPRLVGLSWAVVTWSAFAQFFGGLVELKDWAKDLSVLGHHLDVVGSPDWKPLAVQTVIGLVGIAIGLASYTRRDMPS